MSDELIVDIPTITAAASRVRDIASSVGGQPIDEYTGSGMGDPDVQDAAIEFAAGWDSVLIGLSDAIDNLRVSMGAAVEAYEQLDEKMAQHGKPVAK
ncbi:hypothetical protein BH11ACT2_BH11ACT2_03870 [soil metagenome]